MQHLVDIHKQTLQSHLGKESIFVDDEIKSRRPTSYMALRHEDNPELTHVLKGDQVELSRVFRPPALLPRVT